ncbi:hypothetical protein SAY86_007383 [Trapa natans]|uniref:Uncharacterized protein n=1 Tax=Trapa natans TaxID=22666 RepID=A0AAN7LEF7_TRANT|nr:hypothetical protein SAY86_007383 [Trapa natans]
MMMGRLAPLCEEPIDVEEDNTKNRSKKGWPWRNWLKSRMISMSSFTMFTKKSNLRVLLSVLGCPLFPVPALQKSSINEVSSSAQYILQHFVAATGCRKLDGRVKNTFTTGKIVMAVVDDGGSSGSSAGGAPSAGQQKGCFVMWQMSPNKWLIELAVGGEKVVAGCDGRVAWRHTPWLGSHAARGGVRPLRRALQGLDPVSISAIFSSAQYMGEKSVADEDCFILKLSADQANLADRSDATAETIKHTAYGYFSQRSGLLVHLEDSYLTRIQSPGTRPMYWETTIRSRIEDYRPVDGVMIAHSGRSTATIARFGDDINLRAGPAITQLEETWLIDDVAFNIHGLSMDSFIPPGDVKEYKLPGDSLEQRPPIR